MELPNPIWIIDILEQCQVHHGLSVVTISNCPIPSCFVIFLISTERSNFRSPGIARLRRVWSDNATSFGNWSLWVATINNQCASICNINQLGLPIQISIFDIYIWRPPSRTVCDEIITSSSNFFGRVSDIERRATSKFFFYFPTLNLNQWPELAIQAFEGTVFKVRALRMEKVLPICLFWNSFDIIGARGK